MSEVNRETQIEGIRGQLHDWQHNLAVRVAGEAQALDVEIDKLNDNEFDEVWEVIRTARNSLFAATDTLRELRLRLQDRPPA